MTLAAWPTYDSYMDSGIDWIGQIPAHWEVLPLKFIARLRSGDTISAEQFTETGYPVYGGNGFRGHTCKKTHCGHFVLIGRQGALCGNVNYAKGEFFASEHAIVATPTKPVETIWLGEIIRCANFNRLSQSAAQPGLSVEVISNQRLPFPPHDEQLVIANAIEESSKKINGAISIKEAQITLLRERRQILIQQAVTRGLNPDAPIKDSGIDWIGQIPAHWAVKRNFVLFREMKVSGKAGLPILSVSIHSGVSSEELSDEENIRSIIKIEDRTAYKEVKPGDVAYNMMRAWQGGIGAVSVHGMVSPAYVVARPSSALAADYFELLYRCPAFIRQMDSGSKGITDFRKRLYWDDFKNLLTIVPPRNEQDAIVEHIAGLSTKIEGAIAIKEEQIAALKEYKTCLINAAVTGKIKVA